MDQALLLSFPTSLRRRAVRTRRLAKLARGRAMAALLQDLALALDLDAMSEEVQADPFKRSAADFAARSVA